MEVREQRGKVKINSHVEAHGSYSIEWSYHFPLRPGIRVESEFEISFPEEKLPGAARHSLAEANLTNTRLSLADAASEVRTFALRFLRDSIWLRNNLVNDVTVVQSKSKVIEISVNAFFLRAQDYWTASFFSKIGLFLQSDFKQNTNAIRLLFKEVRVDDPGVWNLYKKEKRHLLTCLSAANRIVQACKEWSLIFSVKEISDGMPKEFGKPFKILPHVFLRELQDLAEFSLITVSRALAEVQTVFVEAHAALAGHEGLDELWERLLDEETWVCRWVEIINSLRVQCQLKSLTEVAVNPETAAFYFERMRELQRQHYQVLDLDFNLNKNETRYDIWIQSAAAAISAFIAFGLMLVWTFFQTDGSVRFEEEGVFALTIFALGNAIAYVIRDRLKDILKSRFKKLFQSGRWKGNCLLKIPGERGDLKKVEIAELEREIWWTKDLDDWDFHIWEEFEVTPDAAEAGARIVKQVWRLPLDEVLHSLDDSKHILRIPTAEGHPLEVPVLKRTVFPFRVRTFVREFKGKKSNTVDCEQFEGRIVTAGRRVFSIES